MHALLVNKIERLKTVLVRALRTPQVTPGGSLSTAVRIQIWNSWVVGPKGQLVNVSGGGEEVFLSAEAFSSYFGSDALETTGNQGPVRGGGGS